MLREAKMQRSREAEMKKYKDKKETKKQRGREAKKGLCFFASCFSASYKVHR